MDMSRTDRRFHRQFEVLSRQFPALRGPLTSLRSARWRLARLPLALLFIIGGTVSFLPFLGIWMLPIGFMLLAVDIPVLRGPITRLVIRARRLVSSLRRWWQARRRRQGRR